MQIPQTDLKIRLVVIQDSLEASGIAVGRCDEAYVISDR